MDYTAMTFPEGSFSKAFTQETANYAIDKRVLFREVYRVLAPGGCYVSLDCFQNRDTFPGKEQACFQRILRGWACAGLARFDEFISLAKEVGLHVTKTSDLTARTTRSARTIWRRHLFFYPFVYLARLVGLVPAELLWHFQAALEQKEMYCAKDNLLMFGYLEARKPGPGES
jgi:SAM-dependent methyltransferase